MKFSDYTLLKNLIPQAYALIERGVTDNGIDWLFEIAKNANNQQAASYAVRFAAERTWCDERRPYFNVYPSILRTFEEMKIASSDFDALKFPFESIGIRFAGEGMTAVVAIHANRWLLLSLQHKTSEWAAFIARSSSPELDLPSDADDTLRDAYNTVLRTFYGICMLGMDSEFIKPEPLSADADRYSKTLDPQLIQKAVRKGHHTFAVGRDIEATPTMRRPHFAIRWTGKGSAVPRLVPVKGCIVQRQKLLTVPTGYLDDIEASS